MFASFLNALIIALSITTFFLKFRLNGSVTSISLTLKFDDSALDMVKIINRTVNKKNI